MSGFNIKDLKFLKAQINFQINKPKITTSGNDPKDIEVSFKPKTTGVETGVEASSNDLMANYMNGITRATIATSDKADIQQLASLTTPNIQAYFKSTPQIYNKTTYTNAENLMTETVVPSLDYAGAVSRITGSTNEFANILEGTKDTPEAMLERFENEVA